MTGDTEARGPLAGVRVVELAGLGPAQLGAMMLADMGADVIRVDRVGAPLATGPSRELLARGRRSLAVDLKSSAGLGLARRLIARADVLLDPYRPGVAERLGLGPEALLPEYPRLVYARMTGWGQTGPLAHVAAHDINYIALSGALEAIGDPDRPPPVPLNLVADFGGGGMLLAFAVAAALFERESSGLGQIVDVAMIDGVASLMTSIQQLIAEGQWRAGRRRNWLQGGAPWYRAYETADGRYVTIGALEPPFYALVLERLGVAAERFPQWDEEHWPELSAELATRFGERDYAHWRALLEGTDACFAPVLSIAEAPDHPHHAARGTYVTHDGVVQPAPAPRFARTPGAIAGPPPRPGEHTLGVLGELGLDEAACRGLLDDGVVAVPTPRGAPR